MNSANKYGVLNYDTQKNIYDFAPEIKLIDLKDI